MPQEQNISVPVLAVCIVLTAVTTAAIFMAITCCTLRSRRKQQDWEAQRDSLQQLNSNLSIPSTIDLHKSYAGPPSKHNASPYTKHSSTFPSPIPGKSLSVEQVHEIGGPITPKEFPGSISLPGKDHRDTIRRQHPWTSIVRNKFSEYSMKQSTRRKHVYLFYDF
ncbi:hypothetical protein BT63DRAFT_424272 [Microthyrium microscopicum]|uniref:Uncharacterized protein n=1 Tax=Microthyrium microscopicum TaxID=703497 RepID=A0A6A6UDU3_9PEZI|nr:hypothetical protein BT63DRAFT_424272 [Microthyrium microscopicum]